MRIGVFGNHDSWYVDELLRVGTARGHVVQPLLFGQFAARVSTRQVEFMCGETDLTTLDVILVRTMPPGSLEQVVARMDMLAGLEAGGVRIINPPRALERAVHEPHILLIRKPEKLGLMAIQQGGVKRHVRAHPRLGALIEEYDREHDSYDG